MNDLDTIRVFEGLGELPFGTSREQAVALLGPDYTIEQLEEGDVEYSWPQHGLTLTFWGDFGLRLGYIDSERATARINDAPLLGMSKAEVKRVVQESLGAEISEEGQNELRNGDLQEWIDVDEYALMFWFLGGKLYRVSWSCGWEGEDQPGFVV